MSDKGSCRVFLRLAYPWSINGLVIRWLAGDARISAKHAPCNGFVIKDLLRQRCLLTVKHGCGLDAQVQVARRQLLAILVLHALSLMRIYYVCENIQNE